MKRRPGLRCCKVRIESTFVIGGDLFQGRGPFEEAPWWVCQEHVNLESVKSEGYADVGQLFPSGGLWAVLRVAMQPGIFSSAVCLLLGAAAVR